MLGRISGLLFLLLISFLRGQGQACTTLGQTPQTAFPVCGVQTFHQSSVPTCSNHEVQVPCSDGVSYVDFNPFWYRFMCYESGTLGFVITPEDLGDDYDWQLFDITGHDPSEVYTNRALFVTGNWSGSYGVTGTSANNSNNISCASDPNAHLTTYSKMPTITEGHEYLLLISHFSGDNQSGYDLDFKGGTASIDDPLKPQMLAASANCSGQVIYIKLNKKVKCSSLAANGSDFVLTSSVAKVKLAAGINCSNSFDMDSLQVTLDKPLPPGNYTLNIQNGNDANTLLDNCANNIPPDSKISFTVYPLVPTPMDSIAPVGCAPDEIKLVFQKPMLCSSVAANGSDFVITGTAPVSIVSAAGENCNNGVSNVITVKLNKAIQTAGNFVITLKEGTDGNTIYDECSQETPAGSSLNFVTADIVSADFSYRVGLGCVNDTLFYSHDGRNQVNNWDWTFDANGTSDARDSFFVFNDYGSKHIKLYVSNDLCSDSATADILLDNELVSRFNVLPSPELCPEDPAQFVDSSIGKIVSWYWNLGDGAVTVMQNPSPKYYPYPLTRNGSTYPISLVVENDLGCFDTSYQNLEVHYSCYIAVPGAFTPNGDGLNDYLYPLNAYKADNLIFRVYNRWGQLVFETKDWTKKWDGRINGYPQAAGTYVWMLSFKNRDTGQAYSLRGTTVLIR
ncbi:T9SS type B sorting domain-containing protein [Parafilimonas terrae]|uniref:Gliding motility-associated C-terminal domain-containing protein n=1 Tax=Parafilimonas terrae TaxID=1465490 RepID=A0A1I5U738_9BACT|nr:gliding motility-associated C-terminal domain-containing protein [Parafilimonas terrae]SFP90426.1 gliding motility-associated C-terminal domain-containing protein [Parafilimonas terrae]